MFVSNPNGKDNFFPELYVATNNIHTGIVKVIKEVHFCSSEIPFCDCSIP